MRISDSNRKILEDEIARLENKKGNGMTPSDVALIRLLKDILEQDIMPWEKSFDCPACNALTLRKYSGLNVYLVPPGEYLTINQIINYNKEHGTNYRTSQILPEDTKYVRILKKDHIILYFNPGKLRKLTKKEEAKLKAGEKIKGLVVDENGEYRIRGKGFYRYYTVYNTAYVYDGEKQFTQHDISKLTKRVDGEQIIANYAKNTGVKIFYDSPGRCFFSPEDDAIHMAPLHTFKSDSDLRSVTEYYSTVFHEMGHSTGMPNRLNRDSFKDYDFKGINNKIVYSMEELVAEFTSALLMGELDIDSEIKNQVLQNNASYIDHWFNFILKDTPDVQRYYNGVGFEKLLYAMRQAERAYRYILTGTVDYSGPDEDKSEQEVTVETADRISSTEQSQP